MMGNKKQRVYYWAFLIVGSFVLGIVSAKYEWTKPTKYVVFGGWMIVLTSLMLYINMKWYRNFSKELIEMGRILVEEGDVESFLERNDILLKDKKAKQFQASYKINRAVACCYQEEFGVAEEWLEQVKPTSLIPSGRAVYFADFAWIKMNLGKMEEGIDILKENEKLLSDMSKLDETLDTLLKMMKVKEYIFYKEMDKAKELFVEVKKREIPYNAKDIENLKRELEEATI